MALLRIQPRDHGAKARVLAAVGTFAYSVDVENVRKAADLTNWESTKAILLELTLEGELIGHRTTKGWVFQKPVR